MKVKKKSERAGLKLNIQKTKIMTSGPITSWQIDGETMETVRVFWGASKSLQMMTAAMKLKDACSLEEVMANLKSILKSSLEEVMANLDTCSLEEFMANLDGQ